MKHRGRRSDLSFNLRGDEMKQMFQIYPELAHELAQGHTQKPPPQQFNNQPSKDVT